MNEPDPVLARMKHLLDGWEAADDRRLIFLTCYQMMTQNIETAIAANDFEDVNWVATLMNNFAEYYFRALDAFESEQSTSPTAWRIAFTAVNNPQTHVLQNLVLGVNAHINYDLVLVLSDLLAPEWQQLTEEQRKMRYRDHCHVNDIIYHTIDAVQDRVIERFDPRFSLVDTLLGPLDEWMTGLLISDWREEVWQHVTQIVDGADNTNRQAVIAQVEQTAIKRARDILGTGGLADLVEFL